MTHPYQEDARNEKLKHLEEAVEGLKGESKYFQQDRDKWVTRYNDMKEQKAKAGVWKHAIIGSVIGCFLVTFGRGCAEGMYHVETQRDTEMTHNCERVCGLYHMEVMTCRTQWVSCIDDTHLEGHHF